MTADQNARIAAIIKEAFTAFDKDNSGSVDVDELRAVLQTVGHDPSKKELQVSTCLSLKFCPFSKHYNMWCVFVLRVLTSSRRNCAQGVVC